MEVIDCTVYDDPTIVAAWTSRLCCIGSHPRSGSHWLRRMIAGVLGIRTGIDIPFGSELNTYVGFEPVHINSAFNSLHNLPIFYASHAKDPYVKICIKRNFPDVLKSCLKARKTKPNMWFVQGGEDSIYERWKEYNEWCCIKAQLVIDYDIMLNNPATVLHTIFKTLKCDVEDWEIEAAVQAGSRSNMLEEQDDMILKQWEVINHAN